VSWRSSVERSGVHQRLERGHKPTQTDWNGMAATAVNSGDFF
jgi:hypothetical protein